MTAFYRQLGMPGRCMFWGMAFTILFIAAGFATDMKEFKSGFYATAIIAFFIAVIGAAIANLECKIDQED